MEINYSQSLGRLRRILDELREQCPWDRKQTWDSLRPQTIEELYELADAIESRKPEAIAEELGDVLLHILFYCRIASEQSMFTLEDVIRKICDKLVARHPHIYADTRVQDEADVKRNWEQIKMKEGKKSLLSGVPAALPALTKAWRLQEKTKEVGFEWEDAGQVWDKVKEELEELEQAQASGNAEETEAEMGDLLFSLVNYARFIGVDPDRALSRTNQKFISRFNYLEAEAVKAGKNLRDMTLGEMDDLWNEAKRTENK